MKPHLSAWAWALGIAAASANAAAHGDDSVVKPEGPAAETTPVVTPTRAKPAAQAAAEEAGSGSTGEASEAKEEEKSRWAGSILLFDQSTTTQTLGIGADYQSADPVYEWWFALKPRYSLYKSKRDSLALNLWMNLYIELTNSDSTTTQREPVVGPSYVSASYSHVLFDANEYKTSVSIGPRVTLPTDMASRNRGQFGGLGAATGLSQNFPIAGKGARAFNSWHLGVSGTYNHPLTRATTGVNSHLGQLRQDIGDRTPAVANGTSASYRDQGVTNISSDQLSGAMGVQNALNLSFSAGLQITPRLGLEASYVILNSWAYVPKDVQVCTLLTGCAEPERIANPTNHRVSTWALASLDYDATDELSVSLGYYNLNGQIGADGLRRSAWWSPDARFFLSLTGNLDAIYQHFAKGAPRPQNAASNSAH